MTRTRFVTGLPSVVSIAAATSLLGRREHHAALLLGLFTLLMPGCGQGNVGDGQTVWPSATVQLDSIGATPEGVVLTSEAMHDAGDGRIVMIHYASVGIFDSTGAYVAQVGRLGSGPGEFGRIVASGPITPSRFWLWDSYQHRLTILNLDSLTFAASEFRPELAEVAGRMVAGQNVRAVDTMGNTLVVAYKAAGPAFPGAKDPIAPEGLYGWWPTTSTAHPAIVAITEGPTDCKVQVDGKEHAIPECRRNTDAASVNGRFVAVARPVDRSSTDDRYHFTLIRTDGDTVSAFDVDLHGQPLTDSIRTDWLSGLRPGDAHWGIEVPRLPRVDPLDFLAVGNDGAIWVRGILRDGKRAWHVISPSGDPIALLWMPDDLWITAWSACGGLASRDLENGRVVLYRLRLLPESGATGSGRVPRCGQPSVPGR